MAGRVESARRAGSCVGSMARGTLTAASSAPPGVAFELERLDWPAPGRLEVAGRWYGVRGLRFVRPVLQVQAGSDLRRLLALLDHKPWQAQDDELWVAAFAWAGEPVELEVAELGVAPSVAVDLLEPPPREEPAPNPLAGEIGMARAEIDHLPAELKARRQALGAERERARELKAQLER